MVEIPYRLTPVEDDPWAGAVNPLSPEEQDRQAQIAALRAEDKPATAYPGATGKVLGLPIRGALNTAMAAKDLLTGALGKRAISAGGELHRTGEYDPEAPVGVLATALGLGVGGIERGAAGVFGGRVGAHNLADRGWPQPKAALKLAEDLEEAGHSTASAQVQASRLLEGTPFTGVHKGADGQWRFEMPDEKARVKLSPPETRDATADLLRRTGREDLIPNKSKLGDVFKHPYVYEAYPGLRNYEATAAPDPRRSGVFYEPDYLGGPAQIHVAGPDVAERTSAAVHEVQHAIQNVEGFARGGNASLRNPVIAEHVDRVQQQARDKAKALDDDAYKWADAELAAGRGPSLSYVRKGADGKPEAVPDRMALLVDYYHKNPELMNQRYVAGKMSQREAREDLAYGVYKRLAGETEARNVQTRRLFTPEERQTMSPGATQQFPNEAQIVTPPKQGLLPLREDGAAARHAARRARQ